jgi:hypothetical protein
MTGSDDLSRPVDEIIRQKSHHSSRIHEKNSTRNDRVNNRGDDRGNDRVSDRWNERGNGNINHDAHKSHSGYNKNRQRVVSSWSDERRINYRHSEMKLIQRPNEAKIRISNLHYEVSERDLVSLFESVGPVSRAIIDYDRAGRSNGIATIIFKSRQDAYRARERFQNVPLDGKAMQIEVPISSNHSNSSPSNARRQHNERIVQYKSGHWNEKR